MNETIGVILAAGIGSRLLPFTKEIPKCLVKINNHPILYYQLKSLEKSGIKKIFLILGYKEALIRQYVKENFPFLTFTFLLNPQYNQTNTLYSLSLAAESIENDKDVLLLNGDVLFDPVIITELLSAPTSTMAAQMKPTTEEEVKFSLDNEGFIKKVSKEVPLERAAGEAFGVNLFKPSFWQILNNQLVQLKRTNPQAYFELGVQKTIDKGQKIRSLDIKDKLAIEIDFPEDLEKAARLIGQSSFEV